MSETVHPIEILLVEGNPDDVHLIEGREGIIYSERSLAMRTASSTPW